MKHQVLRTLFSLFWLLSFQHLPLLASITTQSLKSFGLWTKPLKFNFTKWLVPLLPITAVPWATSYPQAEQPNLQMNSHLYCKREAPQSTTTFTFFPNYLSNNKIGDFWLIKKFQSLWSTTCEMTKLWLWRTMDHRWSTLFCCSNRPAFNLHVRKSLVKFWSNLWLNCQKSPLSIITSSFMNSSSHWSTLSRVSQWSLFGKTPTTNTFTRLLTHLRQDQSNAQTIFWLLETSI